MTRGTSLPPHLERFIREQIASGSFRSEGEVIRAALQMLEAVVRAENPVGPRPEAIAGDMTCPTDRPALPERWETPGEWLAGGPAKGKPPTPGRRSLRGLLADLRSGISFDDIKLARGEMWGSLRHGEAG